MKFRNIFQLGIGCMALALAGCSQFALVNSQTYNDADLSEYKTFRIVDPSMGKLPPGMQMVTYHNIAAAIREQMLERGYTESPTSPLLINFAVTIHKEVTTEPALPPPPPTGPGPVIPHPGYGPGPGPAILNPAHGPGPGPAVQQPYYNGMYPYYIYPRQHYWNNPYAGMQVVTGIYKEGVLTMDMVNIDTMTPLYSSSVATIIDTGNSQYRNLSSIAEAVQTLFSRFPVEVLPQYRSMH